MKPREWRKKVQEICDEHGWEIEVRRGGHLKLSKPGRKFVFTGGTCNDPRDLKNTEAMIRRQEREYEANR